MTLGDRKLLLIFGIGCLLIIVILVILWPYRELIAFLLVGLAVFTILVLLGIRIMQAVADVIGKENEQRLRRSRLRPNDEIPLDGAKVPIPPPQQKGQVAFAGQAATVAGEQTYRTREDELTTAVSIDDYSTRSMDTVPTPVAPITSVPATSNDVSTPEMRTEPDPKAPIVSSQDKTKVLSLFAIARTTLEDDDRALGIQELLAVPASW